MVPDASVPAVVAADPFVPMVPFTTPAALQESSVIAGADPAPIAACVKTPNWVIVIPPPNASVGTLKA